MISELKPSEALTVLAERVSREGAWHCGDSLATDQSGCLLWHLAKVYGLHFRYDRIPYDDLNALDAIEYLAGTARPWRDGNLPCIEPVFRFNDSHTQGECVDLAHRASRLAKEAGQ